MPKLKSGEPSAPVLITLSASCISAAVTGSGFLVKPQFIVVLLKKGVLFLLPPYCRVLVAINLV